MSSSYSTFFWLFFCNKFWFLSLFYQIFTSIIINYYRYLKLSFFYFSFYLFTSFTDSSYFKELKTSNDHEFSLVPISLISDHENVIQHNSKFESLNRQVAKIKKLENLRNFDFLFSDLLDYLFTWVGLDPVFPKGIKKPPSRLNTAPSLGSGALT